MQFPKDFPDKLRSSILVSEVVGKKVALKARGKEFQGLCPFHNEKSPSFTVNDQKGFYHCFGCQAHGDVISFVMNSDGFSYPDAVKKLADDFGLEIPRVEINQEKENKIARDYLILEKIAQFFVKNLYEDLGAEARTYLRRRNLNSTIAKKFRLGYAPSSYEAVINFLKSEKFSEDEISKTGIVGKNDKNKLYDKFRNRVIFPITDKKNNVIAFGGRTLGDDMPKYLNSAETDIFKKNKTLYNYFFARKAIFDKGYAVIVEGYMDVISLAANGIENVVAALGTALGAEHLKELFYITDKIVICLDGDEAGIRAAKRVSEIALPLISAKKSVFFTFLPQKMDPDDFVKEFGAKELEKNFIESTPLSESLLEFTLMDLRLDKKHKVTAENKAKIEANLIAKINLISDPASKKYFSLFVKDALFYLGRGLKKENNFAFIKKAPPKTTNNLADFLAQNIIAMLIKNPVLTHFHDDIFNIKETHFHNENLNEIKEALIDLAEREPETNSEKMLATIEKLGFNNEFKSITDVFSQLKSSDSDSNLIKFRILLLKDLLLHVEQQYKESLGRIDEIETHQTAITDQKIREIFDYRNSLEEKILALEKELM